MDLLTEPSTGATAVEWLVKEYGLKSRKEAVVLGEQLRRVGVIARKDEPSRPFIDDQHALFKFEQGSSESSQLINGTRPLSSSDGGRVSAEPPQSQQQPRPIGKIIKAGSNMSLLNYTNGRMGLSGSAGHPRVQSTSNLNSMNLMSSDVSVTTNPLLAKRAVLLAERNSAANPTGHAVILGGSHAHPMHHQHIHHQTKSHRSTKFASLTRRDRERLSELMEEAGGWDGSHPSKKKDGILKNTIRGLVKPKAIKTSGHEDEENSQSEKKDAAATKGGIALSSSGTPLLG